MTTTYRYYWGGTLISTQTVASDTVVPSSVPTTGLTPGTADLTVTAQKAGELESVVSNATSLVLNASVVSLDATFPKSVFKSNATGATNTTATFTTGGATRTLVAVVSYYTPNDDPYPVTVSWVGGTPANATDWVCRAWPVGTTGGTTTDFSGTAQANHDATIHWTSQIWTATATGVLTNVQVVATRNYPAAELSTSVLSVYSFANARTTFGAAAQHHTPMSEVGGANQAQTLSITPSATGSVLVGILHWGNLPDAGSFTAYSAATTIDYQNQDGGADGGAMAFRGTSATTASTPVTLGSTSSQYAWAMCAIEVLAL